MAENSTCFCICRKEIIFEPCLFVLSSSHVIFIAGFGVFDSSDYLFVIRVKPYLWQTITIAVISSCTMSSGTKWFASKGIREKDHTSIFLTWLLYSCLLSIYLNRNKLIKQVARVKLNQMGWKGGFYLFFFLFTLVESSSRAGNMWLLNMGAESAFVINWPVVSASVFVLVALLLSMYLIFEHLAAYNQPEVCFLLL